MKVKVTVYEVPSGKVLATGVYEVSKDGDLERAVSDVIAQARAAGARPWGFTISVEKADSTP